MFKIEFPFKQYILGDFVCVNGRIFGTLYPGIIYAISLDARSLVWKTPIEGSFVVKGDELLVVSGAEITRIKQSTGDIIGKIPLTDNLGEWPNILYADDYLIVADNQTIWCLDISNWKILWKERVFGRELSQISKPVLCGEFVCVATYVVDGMTRSISDTGTSKVYSLLSGKHVGDIHDIYFPYPPLMVGQKVIHWENERVVATDIVSGKTVWTQGSIDGSPEFPYIFNNYLYFMGDEYIYCVSLETGNIVQKSGRLARDDNAMINQMTANKNGLIILDDQTTVQFYAPVRSKISSKDMEEGESGDRRGDEKNGGK